MAVESAWTATDGYPDGQYEDGSGFGCPRAHRQGLAAGHVYEQLRHVSSGVSDLYRIKAEQELHQPVG